MKLRIALLLTLIAIGFHVYLALHYYDLNLGIDAGQSICNINSHFNCDAVTASRFSTLFGAPIALWGAVTNAVLFFLLLGWVLMWTDDITRHAKYTFWLTSVMAAASLVMGSISALVINTFCLFCMGAYLISFINFVLVMKATKEVSAGGDTRSNGTYLKEIFGSAKSYLFLFAAVPILTGVFHLSQISNPRSETLRRQAKTLIEQWKGATSQTFSLPPVFVKGASDQDAKVTIVEFADFLCGHCRAASPAVAAFLGSRPDVQLRFYVFPLEKACNDVVSIESGGVRCFLAKTVDCAERLSKKGAAVHTRIFEHQDEFQNTGNIDSARTLLTKITGDLNIETPEQKTCVESPETHQQIKAMAKLGSDAGVAGTPTFYVEGRQLVGGQLLPILESVYEEVKKGLK